jgi:superfamily I DNA/RNA helicase
MYYLDTPNGRLDATEEQIAIIDAARSTKDNLLINALAGAAKSTTLQFICKYISGVPILSLAFNKKIADELSKKLPGHVECKTLNALGHRVWAQATGRRLVLNDKKTFELTKEYAESLKGKEKELFYEYFADILRSIGWAKSSGYIPRNTMPHATRLCTREEFIEILEYNQFDDEVPDLVMEAIDSILTTSIKMAYEGIIDFNDQIYMSTLFGGTFPNFPLVMVDETQDLSPLNHVMLEKLARQRLIAVGDPWQSIYGFRGASRGGMQLIKNKFNMTEFTLSVSFRCPQAIVKRAWDRVPHMKWAPWASEGEVRYFDEWTSEDIPDFAAIICRNNAPLFKLALELIKAGRGIKLLGADIGPNLIKLLKKLSSDNPAGQDLHHLIERWKMDTLKKARNASSVEDRAECLHVFAEAGGDLKGAVLYAEKLFATSGPIQLMSGHKSKGLEFDIVFHLDPWRIPSKYATSSDQQDQELNLKYVIETRSKKTLNLISMENFRG